MDFLLDIRLDPIVERLVDVKSSVIQTLTLDPATTVPIGSIISVNGDPTARFETTEEVTNASGIQDDFTVLVEAETAGPVRANAGTLTVIETPVAGWISTINVTDATEGFLREGDDPLRKRYAANVQAGGCRTQGAIIAAVDAVDQVQQVTVFENTLDVTDPVSGLPHTPSKWWCWTAAQATTMTSRRRFGTPRATARRRLVPQTASPRTSQATAKR